MIGIYKMIKNRFMLLLMVMFILGVSFWGFAYKNKPQPPLPKGRIRINNTEITAEFATTLVQRSEGLSWRKKMGEMEGMFFTYESQGRPSFWMLGMQFPLDFIWIRDNKVVDIHQNVPNPDPGKMPVQVSPGTDIHGVLEVNAGFVKKHKIKVGDPVKILPPVSSIP